MSISTQSYESIINLATRYYDQHMPLYFVYEHIDVTCDIILLLLQRKTIKLVRTMSMLLEPIIENDNIIYISIPLVAFLINAPVELPKNTVEFVKDFDIFKGLDYGVKNEEEQYKCFNPQSDDLGEFTPHERIRFTHMVRIVFMCSHFFQHYNEKMPYTVHKKPLNHLERAVQINLDESILPPTVEPRQLDYSLLTNV